MIVLVSWTYRLVNRIISAVVKAKILPAGFIQRKTAKGVKKEVPVLGNHERLYEIQIKDVFKGALGDQLVVKFLVLVRQSLLKCFDVSILGTEFR